MENNENTCFYVDLGKRLVGMHSLEIVGEALKIQWPPHTRGELLLNKREIIFVRMWNPEALGTAGGNIKWYSCCKNGVGSSKS